MRRPASLAIALGIASLVSAGVAGASTTSSGLSIVDRAQHFRFTAPKGFVRTTPTPNGELVSLNDSLEYGQLVVVNPHGLISVAGLKSSVELIEKDTGGSDVVSFTRSSSQRFPAGTVNIVRFTVSSSSSSALVYGLEAGFLRDGRSFAITSYALSETQGTGDLELVLDTWKTT